jgi:hypothetical protein
MNKFGINEGLMKRTTAFLFFFTVLINSFAQDITKHKLNWMPLQFIEIPDQNTQKTIRVNYMFFEGAEHFSGYGILPFFHQQVKIQERASRLNVSIENSVFADLSEAEINSLTSLPISSEIEPRIIIDKKRPTASIDFVPIIKSAGGKYQKLLSFDIKVNTSEFTKKIVNSNAKVYASSSVLNSGTWIKIGVTRNGIYKIDKAFLEKSGIDVSSLDPRKIRVFGNGGGMLPALISDYRIDDLAENAIEVSGETDGSFDADDYVLFYGESPHQWKYDALTKKFKHQLHLYTDTTYYFLTVGPVDGKRISLQSSAAGAATPVTSFNDYDYHELDVINFVKSGREWYGEYFNNLNTYNFSFSFPNITDTVKLTSSMCFRTGDSASYSIISDAGSRNFKASGKYDIFTWCTPGSASINYVPSSANQNVTIVKNSAGEAWLNYLELNARRQLQMSGNQMIFRDARSAGPGNVSEFILSGATSTVKVWDVTNPTDVKSQYFIFSGSDLSFKLPTDSIREFIAFNGQQYFVPDLFGVVSNQNLHGLPVSNMVIVAHPDFISQANQIADMHRADSMKVLIVTLQQIYNEFSSGAQDLTAIRDFTKMIYDRSNSTDSLRYLLLFGDGSYNNKNRNTSSNTNFIPTFQSVNSTNTIDSYTSDDYLGYLSDSDGDWALSEISTDKLDIGIGRLPVKSLTEAQAVTNKILNYVKKDPDAVAACSNSSNGSVFGDWRNIICFVADDQDNNTHINDASTLCSIVNNYRDYNIDKIFLDAYKQVSVAGGNRYPEATAALNRRVERGALIVNYTGHGGELGLAEERVLELHHINSWKNFNRLPLFVTATCEFSRFDDPARTAAGEQILLNPDGGGIGLFTTVRLVYASYNLVLNTNFYSVLFNKINGEMPRMGDLYRLTKNKTGSNVNTRNFTLLGDPAMRLAYPEDSIVTTLINSHSPAIKDTLKALGTATVSGYVADRNGVKLTNFNGVVFPTVYDKPANITTLSNDGVSESQPKTFQLQKNILYKGKASVINGDFSFTFIVPKDISYQTGIGKISYYATDGKSDANGSQENFEIGGINANAPTDITGPEVRLFMNDSNFVFGGITSETPEIFAVIRDSNGVNTSGNSIGHDIAATLDENSEKAIVLNDYYEADLNSYKSGKVRYSLSELAEGTHTLKIKVWDVYDNSSQAYTEFVVAKSAKLALSHVLNYPNPFTTKTKFYFEHNQACNELDVQIQIFTIAGKLVKTLNTFVHSDGFRSDAIEWDGKDEYGDKIGRGVYIYRLKARTSNGNAADKFEKLVILN